MGERGTQRERRRRDEEKEEKESEALALNCSPFVSETSDKTPILASTAVAVVALRRAAYSPRATDRTSCALSILARGKKKERRQKWRERESTKRNEREERLSRTLVLDRPRGGLTGQGVWRHTGTTTEKKVRDRERTKRQRKRDKGAWI